MTELEYLAIRYALASDNFTKITTALSIGTDGLDEDYIKKLNQNYQDTRRDLDLFYNRLIVHVTSKYQFNSNGDIQEKKRETTHVE